MLRKVLYGLGYLLAPLLFFGASTPEAVVRRLRRAGVTITAKTTLDELAAQFEQSTLSRVPMGWDVAYDIETKAHPFAVQQYCIDPDSDSVDSDWLVSEGGSLLDATAASLADGAATVLDWECGESRTGEHEYIQTGASFGLFEGGEDGGTVLHPRGVFARDTLAAYVSQRLREYGALPVQRLDTAGDSHSPFRTLSVSTLPARLFEPSGDREELLAADGNYADLWEAQADAAATPADD
jgi:hypothetical protein